MAATDQHYRNQKALNLIFALSCIAMFLSVIWMLVDDYNKPFKTVQREFRDMEETVSLTRMLEKLPEAGEVDMARQTVAERRKKLADKKAELGEKRKELAAVRDKSDSEFQDI